MDWYIVFFCALAPTLGIAYAAYRLQGKSISLLNPLTWLLASTLLGLTGQLVYVAAYPQELHSYKFLHFFELRELVPYFLTIPVATTILVLGFFAGLRLRVPFLHRLSSSLANRSISAPQLLCINFFVGLISVVVTYFFISRILEATGGGVQDVALRKVEGTLGSLRWMAYPSLVVAGLNIQYSKSRRNTKLY